MDIGVNASPRRSPDHPEEPATLAQWERVLQRARAARQLGLLSMALAYEHQGLALSLRLLEQSPVPGREDDCVAALVVSHLNVACLQAQAAALDAAARLLCRAHSLLLGLMADASHGAALQQAAWRQSRETHAALVRHVQDHGSHPLIASALAAGLHAAAPH